MAAKTVGAKLSEHEAVCAERYAQINGRLKRIEIIMIKAAGSLIVAMLGVIITMLVK
jgi:hypothetical protein